MSIFTQNNVLITSSGRAVLSDFGRAFIIDEIEVSKSLIAAAYYTAPEVLITEDVTPLTKMSDVWSLGVTIFEVRTVALNARDTITELTEIPYARRF